MTASTSARTGLRYPRLFEPLRLGGVELPNRIVMLPAGPSFAFDGTVGDHDLAYYEARAAGGAGLIVVGAFIPHPSSQLRGRPLREGYDRALIPGFARLAGTIHRHGARVVGQLVHLGRDTIGEMDVPLLAPSALRSPRTTQTPHELSAEEIEELIVGFGETAANLREAGFDGVELHAAHSYLIAQFFSPEANHRQDEWGGSLANRVRFALRITDAIRAACGPDFPIGARISGTEETEGGLDLQASVEIAKELVASGGLSYLSVAIGVRGAYVKDMAVPNGVAVPLARAIRQATGVPVIASQRITHPALAEAVLEAGDADLIGMARALIADPGWPARARAGQPELIIPCVGLAQDCRFYNGQGGVSCAHNPAVGRERELGGAPPKAPVRRRIVVAGGGPAGLEAARIAAGRGHEVILFERERHLGGLVTLAARAPSRAEIEGVVSFRAEELARLGVEVRLRTEATPELIIAANPDAVVIAAGSVLQPPAFEVSDGARVVDVPGLLGGGPELLAGVRAAVVVDDGKGFWDTYSAAEYLAASGVKVHVVVAGRQLAAGIPFESVPPLLTRLAGAGVEPHILTAVLQAAPGAVTVYDPFFLAARHELRESVIEADLTVLSGPTQANDALVGALKGRVPSVRAAGDCVAPRRLTHAVLDGHRIGRSL